MSSVTRPSDDHRSILGQIKYTFTPRTLEQSVGAWMIFTALLMIPRPFAAALMSLSELYHVMLSPIGLAAWLFASGVALIGIKKATKWTFLLLNAPSITYSVCLWINFLLVPSVGPIGPSYSLFAWVVSIWMHNKRSRIRESEDKGGSG